MTRILKVEPMDGAPIFVPQHNGPQTGNVFDLFANKGWVEFIGFDPSGNISPMAFPTKEDAEAFLEHSAIYRVGEFEGVKVSIAE